MAGFEGGEYIIAVTEGSSLVAQALERKNGLVRVPQH